VVNEKRCRLAVRQNLRADAISKRVVIPANAGIQFKYVVQSTRKKFMSCATRVMLHWIPAFAGMTNLP